MATTNPKEPAPKRVRPSRAKPKAEDVKKDENQLDLDLTATTETDATDTPTPCPDCGEIHGDVPLEITINGVGSGAPFADKLAAILGLASLTDLGTATESEGPSLPPFSVDQLEFINIRGLPTQSLYILANYLFDHGFVFGGNPFGDFHRNIEHYVLDYDYLQLHHKNKLITGLMQEQLKDGSKVSVPSSIHIDYNIGFSYPEATPEVITVGGIEYKRT